MSVNEYIILFGIILILIDIFFTTDIPTYISYILFTVVFYRELEIHFMYRIILSIIFFFALIIFHYVVWSKTIQLIIDKFISKDNHQVGIDGLKGKNGKVKIIENNKMAYVNGDLYEFSCDNQLEDGEVFRIKEVQNGKIVI